MMVETRSPPPLPRHLRSILRVTAERGGGAPFIPFLPILVFKIILTGICLIGQHQILHYDSNLSSEDNQLLFEEQLKKLPQTQLKFNQDVGWGVPAAVSHIPSWGDHNGFHIHLQKQKEAFQRGLVEKEKLTKSIPKLNPRKNTPSPVSQELTNINDQLESLCLMQPSNFKKGRKPNKDGKKGISPALEDL